MRGMRFVTLLLATLMIGAGYLMAQDGGSTAGSELVSGAGLALGALGVLVTNVIKIAADWIDANVLRLDGKLTALYKPMQPLVALGLTYLLPLVPFLAGLDPNSVAAAPIGVITAMAAREGFLKLKGALG